MEAVTVRVRIHLAGRCANFCINHLAGYYVAYPGTIPSLYLAVWVVQRQLLELKAWPVLYRYLASLVWAALEPNIFPPSKYP